MKKIKFMLATIYILAVFLVLINFGGVSGFVPAMAEEPEADGVDMVVLMYHSINSDQSKSGEYVITPQDLESDLLYLKENGYESVVVADIIAYVNGEGDLPEKPIMITFDDGYYNNYLHAFPLLSEYGFRAVISIIGSETDKYSQNGEINESYSHLTWEQIAEMHTSGVIEFQNHSYNMHKITDQRRGASKNEDETTAEYQELLAKDILLLQQGFEDNISYTPTTYTYPFAAISKDSHMVINALGLQATFSAEQKIFTCIEGDVSCLKMINRINRTSSKSAESIIYSQTMEKNT